MGDLYQWGRATDGHATSMSDTVDRLSTRDEPVLAAFNTEILSTHDWRSPSNDNLWKGVNVIKKPCQTGYRLPTIEEWNEERPTYSRISGHSLHCTKEEQTDG